MSGSIEFELEARNEFNEAFDWYARQSMTAAIGFAAEVDTAIEQILAELLRFARTYAGCRTCRVKRYPYSIVYFATNEAIHIVAIAHSKRRPGYWRDRT